MITMTITAAERDELIAQIARREQELVIERDRFEQYCAEQWDPDGTMARSNRAQRWMQLQRSERALANSKQFLATCEVEPDPDPDPTPAPAMRPVSAPTRFRTAIAWYSSVCGLTGKRIHPGAEICNYQGKWCLYAEAVADDDRNRADGIQRRADRQFVECFTAFADRLPGLVAA